LNKKGQTVDVQIPHDLPYVMGDELRLKQILLNLISNASKFTGECGRLCVAAALDAPDHVGIVVSDTSCGMSQEEIERALEPFMQIHSAYSRNEEGTGLGLPIAKALVLRHGGKFYITGTPNVGTTVKFTLPTGVFPGEGTIAA
jgi:two-component system cell cycle sensor histidine kinase PleC